VRRNLFIIELFIKLFQFIFGIIFLGALGNKKTTVHMIKIDINQKDRLTTSFLWKESFLTDVLNHVAMSIMTADIIKPNSIYLSGKKRNCSEVFCIVKYNKNMAESTVRILDGLFTRLLL